jgi:hypothetical protein
MRRAAHPFVRTVSRVGALVVASATLAAGASGCRHKVTTNDCTQMLDRYLDMVIAADPSTRSLPPAQAAAVRDMKRAVKKTEKSYAQVEAQCETEVSRDEYDCAMKANIPDEWEACIE